MEFREGFPEQIICNMGVDLGRADAGMTKHLLYGQQVGATFKKVGGEAVPEGVWADALFDAVFFREFLHK